MDPGLDLAHLVLYFVVGFAVAGLCTPVGISGAFLLVPFQVSILGLTTVSVSSTGLIFNVISAPAGIVRYWRDGRIDWRLARLVVAGSVPAVIGGVWIRVHVLSDPRVFKGVAGLVLLLLAIRVVIGRRALERLPGRSAVTQDLHPAAVVGLAAAVGFAGGLYGIGGGSLLAPLLVAAGVAVVDVAGAALVATLLSSSAGLLAYVAFAAGPGSTPSWAMAAVLGIGGLAGSYLGARLQPRVPEAALTWLIAALAGLTGLVYLAQALRP